MTEQRPPRERIADAFGRAAGTYDTSATVQRAVCRRLAVLAAGCPAQVPGAILDAGCGTGFALEVLAAANPRHALVALDLAAPMLARCARLDQAQHCVQADIHALPLADASLAGVWSSLSLQWCDPRQAFAEIARALAPGGAAWIATLGPRTFHELRQAFEGIDEAEHVLAYHPPGRWRDAAIEAGLDIVGEERSALRASATDLRALLRDIKAIGAQAVGSGRRRTLLGKGAWARVVDRFEAFRDADGRVGVTYDVLFMILAKPR